MANEKRLIDANALLQIIRLSYERMDSFVPDAPRRYMAKADLLSTIDLIGEVPTVDAVEVVRCKDCKWATAGVIPITPEKLICTKPINWPAVEQTHFCSYGERKDNE